MKRNTVLDTIQDVLKDRDYKDGKSNVNTAERILKAIEKVGMIPNSFCYYATGEYDNIKEVLSAFEIDGGIEYESEDEE